MTQKNIARYFYTIRYLKPKQIVYRLYYMIFNQPWVTVSPVPSHRTWQKPWSALSVMPSAMHQSDTFVCLGESGKIDGPASWRDSTRSKLWLYHLHYFDVLNAVDADKNERVLELLIDRWIDDNPLFCRPGWEPYPLSLRIVNWVKWFSRNAHHVKPTWLESLTLQARVLTRQVEHHILANHIFANAKALVFVGAYFDDASSNRWLKKGLCILDKEVKQQFLADGGHFERSPMYHAILLWDLCDLYQLAQCSDIHSLRLRKPKWHELIIRSLNWLKAMIHDDGEFAFFNDTALHVAPRYAQIVEYAASIGVAVDQSTHIEKDMISLNETGYIALTESPMKAILDVGHIGPDYQPGHAHADTLSFEMSLYGRRIIVNSGISEYGEGEKRRYQRGTMAHNTVCINGQNSSDVWAGFRVAKRAKPFDLIKSETAENRIITCSHDGYLSLSGKNIHQRRWVFEKNKLWIHDSVTGTFEQAQVMHHIHPAVQIESVSERLMKMTLPQGQVVLMGMEGSGSFQLIPSTWHATFGQSENNYCAVGTFDTNEFTTWIVW